MASTRIYDRKVKSRKQAEERAVRLKEQEQENVRAHLKAGSMAKQVEGKKGIHWKNPFSIFDISIDKQIELLEGYAHALESEHRDFIAAHPGKYSRSGARRFEMEFGNVLESIARLKIRALRGDEPIRKKS